MIGYDSRRTGNGSLDAGSTPAYSILKPSKIKGSRISKMKGTQKDAQMKKEELYKFH